MSLSSLGIIHMRRLPLALLAACVFAAVTPTAYARETSCSLTYSMSGGGVFVKRSAGEGVIRCDNGQSMAVNIQSKGGGLTFGHSEITNGMGKFSGVNDIRDLLGSYATAEANAGNSSSASKAQVVTKGSISLALSGRGSGRTLGISFGNFIISQRDEE